MTKPNFLDERAVHDQIGFIVFKDSFLSGWGLAEGGISFYALAVRNDEEIKVVQANGKAYGDMTKPQFIVQVETLKGMLCPRDHLNIVDRRVAARWYVPHAFKD